MPITNDDLPHIQEILNNGKAILFRRPPWYCPMCGKFTVTTFEYIVDKKHFEAKCPTCPGVTLAYAN